MESCQSQLKKIKIKPLKDASILDLSPSAPLGGHGGRVVTLSPPTSAAGVRSPSRPYVGKLVVACRWSAVYSTEPSELYVLVSSALPTTRRDMTCTVLKAT